MFKNFINKIKRQFQNNYIIYFILALFLIFGIVLGSFIVVKYGKNRMFEILSYCNWVLKYLNYELDSWLSVFKFSFFGNIKIIILIWIIGLLDFGMFITPFIICFYGMSIGFTVAFLVNSFSIKGFLFSFFGLLPYYLISIPTILLIGSLSIINSIFKNKFKKNNILNNKQLIDYSYILLLSSILMFLNSCIEIFFSFSLIKLLNIKF